MDLMSAAGFDMVFIGIETPSEESLAECGKKHNKNRDLIEDIKRIQRHGMQVQGGFIIGFDSDTPSIFQRQIEFIQKSGIVTAMVGLLQAPLGTKLYQRLAEEGRLLGSFSGDNVDGMTNIIPKMNIQVLHKGYETVIRSLYAPANYYARASRPSCASTSRRRSACRWTSSTSLHSSAPSCASAFSAKRASSTGSSSSGLCSAVRGCSRWRSRSPFMATTSGRCVTCTWHNTSACSERLIAH